MSSFTEGTFLLHNCTWFLVCFCTIADLIALTCFGFEKMSPWDNHGSVFTIWIVQTFMLQV